MSTSPNDSDRETPWISAFVMSEVTRAKRAEKLNRP